MDNSTLSFINGLDSLVAFHKKYPAVLDDIIQYTTFLPPNSPLKQRVYHCNNGSTMPACECGALVKWHHTKQAYNPHCSVKCANNDPSKKERIRQAVHDKYGVPSFAQHTIPNEVLLNLQDVGWLTDQHHNQEKSLHEIAADQQVHVTTVWGYFKRHSIPVRTFSRSHGERKISMMLTEHDISHITNTKSIIPPLELDIFIPEHNLAIEFSGLYWHSDKHQRIDNNYHASKMLACESRGIRLITIFEDELIHQEQLVYDKILSALNKDIRPTIYARQCEVHPISTHIASAFLDSYHIQGSGRGSVRLGLFTGTDMVACMIFIAHENGKYTLNRYATSCRIPGGFSKLLHHFCRTYPWTQVVSFADRRWSVGNVYTTCGFTQDAILLPDYRYVDKKTMTRVHKFNFRRNKLKALLGTEFNASESEWGNLRRCGWHRIYDCGLIRYVLTNTQ